MKYVLMISPNNFPKGDAGAIRDEFFAEIYHSLGYEVFHIGMNPLEKKGKYKFIFFYSIYQTKKNMIDKIIKFWDYKNRLEHIINTIINEFGIPSLIHFYDIQFPGIRYVQNFCRHNSIASIHDSVEWYSASEFKLGVFNYQYILKNLTNYLSIKKETKIITISSYLNDYFKKRNYDVIRIPVIMDVDEYNIIEKQKNDHVIKIVYAGNPSKKDYLIECIDGFCLLPDSVKEKFSFSIYGVNESYFFEQRAKDVLPKQISFFGRVSHKRVIDALLNSDFCIFVRPSNQRYAKAGFPTKVVESMMCGCIPLTNITSDLSEYLRNNDNSIIIDDYKAKSISESLIYISKLDHKQINQLKHNAKRESSKSFDYKNYIEVLSDFIDLKGDKK